MEELAPSEANLTFQLWWRRASRRAGRERRKAINTIIILVTWEFWKHRNSVVFDGSRPSVKLLLRTIKNEARLWAMAGAKKLQQLLP
ncbi:hypothetical protein PR202_ga23837 [Eleusine coracana subsp. coracana]|uniref:Uncharacterized protein n=1 Tax=Eleusine coracana subsp. coracana TaxID=191504 RepID=A0AAV5D6W0_ELECO|nr:hypothetical protein PR202_ga23837 [Eleusine coracana subsp. coracana]